MAKIILELSDDQTLRLKKFLIRSMEQLAIEAKEVEDLAEKTQKHTGLEQISAELAAAAEEYRDRIGAAQELDRLLYRQGLETEPGSPPGKTKKAAAPAKKLDRGKVWALHDAGWPAAKIADEMRCSFQAVYKILKEGEKKDVLQDTGDSRVLPAAGGSGSDGQ